MDVNDRYPDPRHADRPPADHATYPRPRCPACGSSHLRAQRTLITDPDDDSVLRRTQCQGCGHKFTLLLT